MCNPRHAPPLLAVPFLALGCGAGAAGGDDDVAPGACPTGLGAWTGRDDVAPAQSPPCGLAPEQVPMFVALGFDDNGQPGGMSWAIDMLASRGQASFFVTCSYGQAGPWRAAYQAGHEIGNHTVSHATDRGVGASRWLQEMHDCNAYLVDEVGVPLEEIQGFRTPYLRYDDDTLAAVHQVGFRYDTSIEEGYEWDFGPMDGTNYYWPYTLDRGSPGHDVQVGWPGSTLPPITAHPGLWELPVYAVVVPPDDRAADYGIPPGLRADLKRRQAWFSEESGLITGFDYNLWASTAVGGFAMSKDEVVATLKYTLDQRLAGNRAPFLFGAHTDYYVAAWNGNAAGTPADADRRAAIEEVLDYAASKPEVEIVTYRHVLDWVRNPVPRR
jgi:peptidoglycan/xylan/chitin deacetylase (PgdA/CDA1 family)